jgi:hypothetical protein
VHLWIGIEDTRVFLYRISLVSLDIYVSHPISIVNNGDQEAKEAQLSFCNTCHKCGQYFVASFGFYTFAYLHP